MVMPFRPLSTFCHWNASSPAKSSASSSGGVSSFCWKQIIFAGSKSFSVPAFLPCVGSFSANVNHAPHVFVTFARQPAHLQVFSGERVFHRGAKRFPNFSGAHLAEHEFREFPVHRKLEVDFHRRSRASVSD
jgi:hypothetical protein